MVSCWYVHRMAENLKQTAFLVNHGTIIQTEITCKKIPL